MLVGVFELLQAKREEISAWQEYVEAVRDYWLARTELRRIAGGSLPGDVDSWTSDMIGVEGLLGSERPAATRSPEMPAHSHHGDPQ